MRQFLTPRIRLDTVLPFVVILVIAPVLALIGALGGPYVTLFFAGLIGVAISFAVQLNFQVFVCFIAGSVVAGLLEYFGGVTQGYWIPYLMGALFFLRAFIERIKPTGTSVKSSSWAARAQGGTVSLIALLSFTYFAILVFGALVAAPPLLQVVAAMKNYLFLWGLLVVLVWGNWKLADTTRFWTLLIAVACLQWPFVLYQRFFVAARRKDAAAWDAIVGTFGGNPQFGGHSASMAFVCCVAIAALVWRMKEKKLTLALGIPLLLTCFIPIALAEVKAAFVWLVVVFLVLFARQIGRQPFRALLTLLAGVVLVGGLGLAYQANYQDSRGGGSLQEIYDKQIKYSLDPHEYRSDLKRIGRMTALMYWWEKHDILNDPVAMLAGHGVGASRSASTLAVGEVARKLPFPVDISSASVLLWDVGLLGALTFTALLIAAGFGGLRLSQSPVLEAGWREANLLATCVLAMATVGLLYNKDAIDDPVIETLIFFSIAQVVLARRTLANRSSTKHAALPADTLPTRRQASLPTVAR